MRISSSCFSFWEPRHLDPYTCTGRGALLRISPWRWPIVCRRPFSMATCTLILELLLGPSQVEVAFIHIQVHIFGKIFQLWVFPHALLTKAFTYSFEGRVALWSRVASMCSLFLKEFLFGQNAPREMFTHNKELKWNGVCSFGIHSFHHAFTQLHLSKKQKNSKYTAAIYYMRGSLIRTQKKSEQFHHDSI